MAVLLSSLSLSVSANIDESSCPSIDSINMIQGGFASSHNNAGNWGGRTRSKKYEEIVSFEEVTMFEYKVDQEATMKEFGKCTYKTEDTLLDLRLSHKITVENYSGNIEIVEDYSGNWEKTLIYFGKITHLVCRDTSPENCRFTLKKD